MMVRLARRRICYYGGSTVGRVVHVFFSSFSSVMSIRDWR